MNTESIAFHQEFRQRITRGYQVADNLRTTLRAVKANVSENPVTFTLQVLHRFPNPRVNRFLNIVASRRRGVDSVLGALALAASGNVEQLRLRFPENARLATTARKASRLSGILLAVNEPSLALTMLTGQPGKNPGIIRARARADWYLGKLDEAIDRLGSTSGNARLLAQYRSELEILSGFELILSPELGYTPMANKVLHLVTNSLPHTGSGYAQRTHSVLRALSDAGWHPRAATRLGYPVTIGQLLANGHDDIDGIRYVRLLSSRMGVTQQERIQQQTELLADLVREYRPAIIHTTTDYTNAVAVRAVARAFGIPWVYEVRGQLADTWAAARPEGAKSTQRYVLFKEREAEAAQSASAVITLGSNMRDELVRAGVDESKVTICPNAVGEGFLLPPVEQLVARGQLGLDTGCQYIGTVSSIVGYEGLDDLVKAFALLAPVRPGLRLLIVGDGVELEPLRHLARELGVLDKCVMPGRVDRSLAPLYHEALDIFVVPRKDLSVTRSVTPLKPVEASARSRPVVASDLPALRELVFDGETGLLAAPNDPVDLAEKLRVLLDNESLRRELGANGRVMVLQNRTWSANAGRITDLYDQLCAASSSSCPL